MLIQRYGIRFKNTFSIKAGNGVIGYSENSVKH
jgi:hypothetical protein